MNKLQRHRQQLITAAAKGVTDPADERKESSKQPEQEDINPLSIITRMATARALRLVASRPSTTHHSLLPVQRRLLSASTEAGGAGDAAVHSGDAPSDDYTDRPPRFSGAEEATKGGHGKHASTPPTSGSGGKERVPPFAPSGKLGSQELADPSRASSFTQKRQLSSGAARRDSREEATPGSEESAARMVREEDREYYRTHKPSPLAEVEFADTRKPITRATDGGASDRYSDVPGRMVEDTVDDTLARAEAMFREAASRGNPEWPHSRALAEMLARRQQGNDKAGRRSAPWGS
ncbi:hypothetical protein BAE44_0016110 [Dichanthelium oligosanthes]|uniref:Uncharacterized protein n=1 Tax=Dichanthelium oligosanthes TaxID=888268 RepID=A0A1E5VCY8_9POAL|nr:hypothetical protein BAE44_0016110 [Dichanthelium oligosanthes]